MIFCHCKAQVKDRFEDAALHCLRSISGKEASRVILLGWADDILLASARDNDTARKQFDANLRSVFEVSPWTSGEAGFILGMKVTRDW